MTDYRTRAERERTQYNERSVKRDVVNSYFAHANTFLFSRLFADARTYLRRCEGKKVLEIGCDGWKVWLDDPGIIPGEIHCINISETEIATAVRRSEAGKVKPTFHLMDAHKLDFPDDSFDVVFGGAILHHLNLSVAIAEVYRVLKPGGVFIFSEPLNINPASKLVRILTPKARTVDERALEFKDLRTIRRYFDVSVTGYQLFSIPFNFVSLLLYKNADNPVMQFADFLDRNAQRVIPFLKYYYRYALITGFKQPNGPAAA